MAHVQEEIYYRTDHHWTTDGAWYGYEAFAAAAGRQAIQAGFRAAPHVRGLLGDLFQQGEKV